MPATNIDFSSLRFNLREISEGRILSQYREEDLFKKLLGAITDEIQELLDAIVDLMEYRTINKAVAGQLDAIGRIVGRPRTTYNYDEDYWFTTDKEGLGTENGHWWVTGAQQAVSTEMDDITYRKFIWMTVQQNHNLFSSKPEIVNAIYEGLGEKVGIQIDGMTIGKIFAQQTISLTNYSLLDYHSNTSLTDNDYMFAYPAATSISKKVKV